ncbi:MAG: calcium/proton exchanger [Chloroflexi bacterium]|nr:calcium/proton exchanger [Chloroflexota bacterium]
MLKPFRGSRLVDGLFVFAPLSLALSFLGAAPLWVFVAAALAMVPATRLLAATTESIAARSGNLGSSLVNATFGNAIELLIAFFAIRAGLLDVVRASIIGSIVLNILLLIGLSMVAGGLKFKEQRFNTTAAGVSSTMLLLAVAGLALPSLYSLTQRAPPLAMSEAVSTVLAFIYLLGLAFTLVTHRHLFVAPRVAPDERQPRYGYRAATILLLVSVGIIALESHLFVGAIEPASQELGLSPTFIGLVVIAILTNLPEHMAALTFARRNNVDLSLSIGLNSAIQIALFVVPLMVLISLVVGNPLHLVFNPFELVSLILAVVIVNYLSSDGVCNWLEGAQLIAMYLLIVIALFFV